MRYGNARRACRGAKAERDYKGVALISFLIRNVYILLNQLKIIKNIYNKAKHYDKRKNLDMDAGKGKGL